MKLMLLNVVVVNNGWWVISNGARTGRGVQATWINEGIQYSYLHTKYLVLVYAVRYCLPFFVPIHSFMASSF